MDGELAEYAETDGDVKRHPRNGEPPRPIARTQQENTAHDRETLGKLDPDPIRRAKGLEVGDGTADAHGEIEARDHDHRHRNLPLALVVGAFPASVFAHVSAI